MDERMKDLSCNLEIRIQQPLVVNEKEIFVDEMRRKTLKLALDTINTLKVLPNSFLQRNVNDQLTRYITSVGANYRAACRARSRREFYAKLSKVI